MFCISPATVNSVHSTTTTELMPIARRVESDCRATRLSRLRAGHFGGSREVAYRAAQPRRRGDGAVTSAWRIARGDGGARGR